jgi:hypothetical protein
MIGKATIVDNVVAINTYLHDASHSSARQLLERKYHSETATDLIEDGIDLHLDAHSPVSEWDAHGCGYTDPL